MFFLGQAHGFMQRNDANALSLVINEEDLRGTNATIDGKFFRRNMFVLNNESLEKRNYRGFRICDEFEEEYEYWPRRTEIFRIFLRFEAAKNRKIPCFHFFCMQFEEEYEYWPKRIETYAEVRRNILTKKCIKKMETMWR